MKILCLCHNTPFPPNKGDKIRPYHILRSLAERHEIHLLSLSKIPSDVRYAADLEEFCERCEIVPLSAVASKAAALLCLSTPYPMTFGYFYSRRFLNLVKYRAAEGSFDAVLAFCSSMAPYLLPLQVPRKVIDFMDIDSEKWRQYARVSSWPKSFLFAREHRRLAHWERKLYEACDHSVVTTEVEKERLAGMTGDRGEKVLVVPNGIDLAYYSRQTPQPSHLRIVFTGQMDYLPNVDAVLYFYVNIYPHILRAVPEVQLYIVGRNPDPELSRVCAEAVVTGEVEDIREYLHTARVFIAPLRLAFGVQNKVLEAMAGGIPVVASSKIARSLSASVGEDLLASDEPQEFAAHVIRLLQDETFAREVGESGRRYVECHHNWQVLLEDFDRCLKEDSADAAVSWKSAESDP